MAGYAPAVDPRSPEWEENVPRVLADLAASSGVSVEQAGDALARLGAALGPHARSVGLAATGVGRTLGETAAEAERQSARLKALLETGCLNYDEARRQAGLGDLFVEEYFGEDGMAGRRGLAGRGRRRGKRAEIPPEAAPIASYLRVHHDEASMRTSIYHKNGSLLREYDDEEEHRPIGQILVEDFVPLICSSCGEVKGTPLCDPCRKEIVADLLEGLDHE